MCGRCMSITIPNCWGVPNPGMLVLSEDDTGCAEHAAEYSAGNDVLALVERGDLSGSGFGFRALKESWILRNPRT